MNNVILTTAYFPPIEYFKSIINSKLAYLEAHENYSRQSYRNRFNILSCNGVLSLSIPIVKTTNIKQNILDVQIDYSTNWIRLHKNAIISAYGKSPFFIHYSDEIINSIDNSKKYLFDFNLIIIEKIINILNLKKELIKTDSFIKNHENDFSDLRYTIHPKQSTNIPLSHYIQTFNDRFEFIPNLSIIDLIFNLGNDSLQYLIQNKKATN